MNDDYLKRIEPENRDLLTRQIRDVKNGHVDCCCGVALAVHDTFRCLYCGMWFCKTCAEEHFGCTVKEWVAGKEVDAAFEAYALDHYREFEAWPVEFETPSGEVWDADACMGAVEYLDLRPPAKG